MQNYSAFFHIDAAQSFGKEDGLEQIDFDLLSASSHKIYGPQGIGALVVKRQGNIRIPISSLVHGGGQERGLRPGTVPVALAVGFGKASNLATLESTSRATKSRALKNALLSDLSKVNHSINGDESRCQPHVVNVRFIGVDSEALMMALRESHAISNGSACTSESYTSSHVLIAMGLNEDEATESVRLSWASDTSKISTSILIEVVKNLASND
jgi:cysteine desulfurase